MSGVAAALARVHEQIAGAAQRAGRSPSEVTLVAVSKTQPVALLAEALAAGQRDFGENRVQEAVAKYKELGTAARWHFVGRLQRNKIRHLVGWVDCIHSLDSAEHAVEIDRRADRPVEVLIEVNVAGEVSRGGIQPAELLPLLDQVAGLAHVQVAGLMAMAPVVASPDAARPYFRQLAGLREQAAAAFPALALHHLSMGMSQDYVVAVEEGATLVRVGEAIFGRRSTRPAAPGDEAPLDPDSGPYGQHAGNVEGKVTS